MPWGVGDIGRNVAAVVQDRSLRLVLFAFAIFRPTESAQWIAILVYAYRDGGTGAMGVAAVALLVPAALLAPFVAQIGDRMPRERALAVAYLAQGVAAGLTAVALWADLPPPAVYAGAVLLNIAITATRPTHLSVLPELADTPAQLTAANALTSSLEGFAIFIGPLLAGVMIALEGPWLVFAVMAVALSVMGLALLAVHARSHLVTQGSSAGGALAGFRELRRRPGARLLLGFVTGQTAVIGALDVLVVILAYGVLSMGPAGPGVLSAAVGVGGLLGAAAAMTLIGRARLAPAFLLGVIAIGVPIALIAFATGPATALLLLGIAGIGKTFFDVTARTLLQRTVDDDVLARVFGVQEGFAMAALALGSALAPILVVTLGVDATFVLAGLSLPLVALLVIRRIRAVDRDARLADPDDIALLRGTPIFEPLGPASIERVARNLIHVDADPGMVVIREGDPGDRFYVIASGEMEVSRHDVPVAKLGPGDFFGEIALLRNIPRTATVAASGFASLRSLDRAQFLAAVTGSRRGGRGPRRGDGPADRRAATTDTSSQHRGANPPGGRAERPGGAPLSGPGPRPFSAGVLDHLGSSPDGGHHPDPVARRGQLRTRQQRRVPHVPGRGARPVGARHARCGRGLRDRAGRDRLSARALPGRRRGHRLLQRRGVRHLLDPHGRADHREGGLGGRGIGVGDRRARSRRADRHGR